MPLLRVVSTAVALALLSNFVIAQTGYFGSAKININPTTPIRLSGFAARSSLPEATGIQQDIYAQAAAFGMGADTALLLTVDSTGVPDNVVDVVRGSLSSNLGIAPERIVIASTHTHSGPHINGYLPNLFDPAVRPLSPIEQQHVDLYTSQLTGWLEQVAVDALNNRSAGHQFSWGQGTASFGQNRRGMPIAPNDHDLPVLRVSDNDGTVRAILTSYATHATTLSPSDNLVSGDWPGYARAALESLYPEAVAMIMIGAGGDSNPTPRGTVALAQSYGQSVANEVQRLINHNLMTPVSPNIQAKLGAVELHFATQLEPGDPSSARLAPSPASHIYEITSWTFGDDLAMLFMPGEVTVDYSLRLKSELSDGRLWVNSFSNDVPAYIPSERILYEGGYEPDGSTYWYAIPGRFAHGLENKIVGEARRQLDPFFFPSDRLKLLVDWATGEVAIHNPTEAPISFDAYTITSTDGRLNPSADHWNSLQAQAVPSWEQADNVNLHRLTEFNPFGSTVLDPGESLVLGTPYSVSPPAQFGDPLVPPHDLDFHYATPEKSSVVGLLHTTGPHNNLVLTIDPATGRGVLQNQSPFFDVAIDAYTITSASGRLRAEDDSWISLQDQTLEGWEEADDANNYRLTEFNPAGSTWLIGGGMILSLGMPVDITGGELELEDFSFEFAIAGGQIMEGVVVLGSLSFGPGDYNNDGVVNIVDYEIWRNGFGQSVAPGTGADGNSNGVVDAADYIIWRKYLSTATQDASASPVPEPTCAVLLSIVLLARYCVRCRLPNCTQCRTQ